MNPAVSPPLLSLPWLWWGTDRGGTCQVQSSPSGTKCFVIRKDSDLRRAEFSSINHHPDIQGLLCLAGTRCPTASRPKSGVHRENSDSRWKIEPHAALEPSICLLASYTQRLEIHAASYLRALSAGHFPQPDPLGSSPHSVFPTGFAKSETVSGSLETYFRATSVFPSHGTLRKCCGLKVYTTPPHPTPSRPAIHLLKSSPSQGDGAKRWGLGDAMKS